MNKNIIIEYVKQQLKVNGFELVEEYKFLTKRKFRFDYAIPKYKVAIEQEGGVYISGRHTRGSGYVKDMEKYNLASINNWLLLRYTPKQIRQNPIKVIQEIIICCDNRKDVI